MLWAARQILAPCKYLFIRSGASPTQSKLAYDFIIPGFLTAATAGACIALGVPLSIAKIAGFVSGLSTLLALLIGFYMAALAAVATFHREGIDNLLRGDDAILMVRNPEGGKKKPKKLSYRQFISYLFGYLSLLSLSLYILLIFLDKAWPMISTKLESREIFGIQANLFIEPPIFIATTFATWQLLIVSMLGIYFLAERIQSLNDPET